MNRFVAWALVLGCGATGAWAEDPLKAAMATVRAGEPLAALDKFEAALDADPNNLRIGAEYRQAAIQVEAYDRCLAFLEELVAEHPTSPNAILNYGFAHVDKIPVEGAITGVILANTALTQFTAALKLEETWLVRYTRGNSYIYWPVIFGRAPNGIADLERAIELSKKVDRRDFHARAYVALGDGYWRLGEQDKMLEIWRTGLKLFPDNPHLLARHSLSGEALESFFEKHFDMGTRVETHLRELFVRENEN